MLVERYSVAGRQPELRSGTFTGRAWLERVLTAEGVGVNSVFFEPGSRTYWPPPWRCPRSAGCR